MAPKSSGRGRSKTNNHLPPEKVQPCNGPNNSFAEEDIERTLHSLRSTATDEAAVDTLNFSDNFLQHFFSFFVLGAQRINLETQSCEDIRAIINLVREKQKDLEIVSLMARRVHAENMQLRSSNKQLEASRKAREYEIGQLKEEVAKKESLLCILSHDMSRDTETSQSEVVDCWEDREHLCNDGDGCDSKEKRSQLVMEKVQEKISGLEQENKELRRSMEKCFSETEKLESWEKALMDDLFCLLRQSSSEVKQLRDELSNKKAALHKTQTDKANILAELVDLHRNYNSLSSEYDSLLDAVDEASSGPPQYLHFKINEILTHFSKRKEMSRSWYADNRKQNNWNNKHHSKDRYHGRPQQSQSFSQSNWPKKEFVNSSLCGRPIETEQIDWNEHILSEKVQNSELVANTTPAGNSAMVGWNKSGGGTPMTSPKDANDVTTSAAADDVTSNTSASRATTYAQAVSSRPPSRTVSMEDLTNVALLPPDTKVRTPVTPDGGDGKLFHGAMSGNISDWMSAGSGRTWRRRKQNQENYLCGNSSGAEKGGSGTFASRPGGEGTSRGGRMKRFNSNLSLSSCGGSTNHNHSTGNQSAPQNHDVTIRRPGSSGRRRVDSHNEVFSDSFDASNHYNDKLVATQQKNSNNGSDFKQHSSHGGGGQLKRNRYGSMHNLHT